MSLQPRSDDNINLELAQQGNISCHSNMVSFANAIADYDFEDDFGVGDDLSWESLDQSVFGEGGFASPRSPPGDESQPASTTMPMPWRSWSDALLANTGKASQTDLNDSDDLFSTFLCDPDASACESEESNLLNGLDDEAEHCGIHAHNLDNETDAQPRCLTPSFVQALELCDARLCGTKRSANDEEPVIATIAEDDAETDVESRASSPDEPSRKRMKRGEHVKGRTQMQETAREGQKHWATKVVELRDEWETKNVGRLNKQYVWQLRMCERLRVKPQRECILLALQIATVDGLIMPFPFIDSKHSLGWSGFQVKKDHSGEFRKRITGMFKDDCKSTTVNNTFRRAGLVAEGNWERAWRGLSPFVYPHWQNAS